MEKRTSLAILGCCTADSQTDAGRHQLYNNNWLVLFYSIARSLTKLQYFSKVTSPTPHVCLEARMLRMAKPLSVTDVMAVDALVYFRRVSLGGRKKPRGTATILLLRILLLISRSQKAELLELRC